MKLGKKFYRREKPTVFDTHVFIYLFGVLRRFQHCTGHIMTGSWKGRGNQYIEFARVVYCKLPTNSKQLPAFPLTAMTGIEPRPQRWEVLPLCHRGPFDTHVKKQYTICVTNYTTISPPLPTFFNWHLHYCHLTIQSEQIHHPLLLAPGKLVLWPCMPEFCVPLKTKPQCLVSTPTILAE